MRRVVAEKRASDEATFVSPAKRYKRDRKRIVVDDFDLEGIRRAVHEFYSDKKYPTLESLLALLKERGLFDGERVKHLSMLALPGELRQSRGFDLIRIHQIQIPSSYMGIHGWWQGI